MDKETELSKVLFLLAAVYEKDLGEGASAGESLIAYQQGRHDALQAVIQCTGYDEKFKQWREKLCRKV